MGWNEDQGAVSAISIAPGPFLTVPLPVIDRLQRRFSIGRICVVADRGMVCAEAIAGLEARLFYILGARERTDKLVREIVLTDDVPGGFGQEALMEAAGACSIFSVCTGALLCGAAGLLKGHRATTHWASFHLLPFFGAIPVNERQPSGRTT